MSLSRTGHDYVYYFPFLLEKNEKKLDEHLISKGILLKTPQINVEKWP